MSVRLVDSWLGTTGLTTLWSRLKYFKSGRTAVVLKPNRTVLERKEKLKKVYMMSEEWRVKKR